MRPRTVTAGGHRRPAERRTDITGRSFSVATDDKIDRIVHLALNTAAGRELMDFLESITLRTVLPPEASDAALRDMEAQRRLVAMLKVRAKRADDER